MYILSYLLIKYLYNHRYNILLSILLYSKLEVYSAANYCARATIHDRFTLQLVDFVGFFKQVLSDYRQLNFLF